MAEPVTADSQNPPGYCLSCQKLVVGCMLQTVTKILEDSGVSYKSTEKQNLAQPPLANSLPSLCSLAADSACRDTSWGLHRVTSHSGIMERTPSLMLMLVVQTN